jgi:hypothetical protein
VLHQELVEDRPVDGDRRQRGGGGWRGAGARQQLRAIQAYWTILRQGSFSVGKTTGARL